MFFLLAQTVFHGVLSDVVLMFSDQLIILQELFVNQYHDILML